jgi:hypothetical protein
MSWDFSSEEVIVDKLESQQRVIFAFTKKIKDLEAKLAIAVEALEFYASQETYSKGYNGKLIQVRVFKKDETLVNDLFTAGKRARESLVKIRGDV